MISKLIVNILSRLDQYIASNTSYSRSQVVKLIKAGNIQINNKIVTKSSQVVDVGDEITIDFALPDNNTQIIPDDTIEINYLYKDEYLAIINKKRGLVVHPSSGHKNDTLVNYLLKQDPNFKYEITDINNRPGIVHRIDKDTQGILVIAYKQNVLELLQQEIQIGKLHREYLALVNGKVIDKLFKVDAPLTKPNHTVRKAKVNTVSGRNAVTHFEFITYKNNVSLLKCKLETGRTHQIRAHLSFINHPIVGDTLYGGSNKYLTDGQCLTAYKIEFIHPITKKKIVCFAPLDEYFKKALDYYYK